MESNNAAINGDLSRQKFELIYMNCDGDHILTDNIVVPKSYTIKKILESLLIDSTLICIYAGEPQYGNDGELENTKIDPQYFENTIEELNLWHPSDLLQLIIFSC
jgi:hypothetical protein